MTRGTPIVILLLLCALTMIIVPLHRLDGQTCPACPMPPPTQRGMQGGIQTCQNGQWVCTYTPIVVDVGGDGFDLTDVDHGLNSVYFPGFRRSGQVGPQGE